MLPPIRKQIEENETNITCMMNYMPSPNGQKYIMRMTVDASYNNEKECEQYMLDFVQEIEEFINNKKINVSQNLLSNNSNSTEELEHQTKNDGSIVVNGTRYMPRTVDGIVLGSAEDELKDYRTFEEMYLPATIHNHLEYTEADIPKPRITIQPDGNPFSIVTEGMNLDDIPIELRPALLPRDTRNVSPYHFDEETNMPIPNDEPEGNDYVPGMTKLKQPTYSHGLEFNKDKKPLKDTTPLGHVVHEQKNLGSS